MIRHRRQRKKVLDPFTSEARSPLEILAMLAGRTNFTTPVEGKSTAAPKITAVDVAHAIAAADDKLGASVALAVACQRYGEWPQVHRLGYPRLLTELERQRKKPGIVSGAKSWRIRLVLQDAFQDLICPQHRPSYRAAALNNGIDEGAYRFLHRHISDYLSAAASTAASDACRFLFAPMAIPRRNSLILADAGGGIEVLVAPDPITLAQSLNVGSDTTAWLIQEMLAPGARERTLGTLTLNGHVRVAIYVEI